MIFGGKEIAKEIPLPKNPNPNREEGKREKRLTGVEHRRPGRVVPLDPEAHRKGPLDEEHHLLAGQRTPEPNHSTAAHSPKERARPARDLTTVPSPLRFFLVGLIRQGGGERVEKMGEGKRSWRGAPRWRSSSSPSTVTVSGVGDGRQRATGGRRARGGNDLGFPPGRRLGRFCSTEECAGLSD